MGGEAGEKIGDFIFFLSDQRNMKFANALDYAVIDPLLISCTNTVTGEKSGTPLV
jgi:hypothetical protein